MLSADGTVVHGYIITCHWFRALLIMETPKYASMHKVKVSYIVLKMFKLCTVYGRRKQGVSVVHYVLCLVLL